MTMSRMLSVRLEEPLYEALMEGAEQDGRSLSNYVARLLAEATRLREGHSTLGQTPGSSPAQRGARDTTESVKGRASKSTVKKGAPLVVVREEETDAEREAERRAAQKIIDRVQKARERPEPVLAPRDENDEDEGEYFARIQRENKLRAQGVGPDPW